MANATMKKFGYPASAVAEASGWTVQTRPQQVTLGSLVLVCSEPVSRFGDASPEAFASLQPVVRRIERMLGSFVRYEKINYLMLMMVDPDVHFHVLPRYDGSRSWQGIEFADSGWPGPPSLTSGVALESDELARLTDQLRGAWEEAAE